MHVLFELNGWYYVVILTRRSAFIWIQKALTDSSQRYGSELVIQNSDLDWP